jgi:hypothetical protein
MLVPGWFLEPLTDKLRSDGLDVATAILRAPLDVCLDRASSRPSRPLHDPAVVEQLWAGFDDLGDLEQLVINTGDQDAGATAARVMRVLASMPEDLHR